jgi:Protein of unknown function (DUF551)
MEWINIEERMPPAEQEILATDGEKIEKVYIYLDPPNPIRWYNYMEWTEWVGVTHWMPLPIPPNRVS